jgi:pimeloyl-ACP methyl ester carboxylesterase
MVLVGDGHGASALADFAQEIPDRVRGLVLFNSSGGLATPGLRRLPGVEILAVPGHGRSGARSIGMLTTFAARAGKAEAVTIETQRQWPWSIAMPLAGPEIEAFAARVTARVK